MGGRAGGRAGGDKLPARTEGMTAFSDFCRGGEGGGGLGRAGGAGLAKDGGLGRGVVRACYNA